MKLIVYSRFLTGICFLVAWFQICPWGQNRYSTYCLAFHWNNMRINPFARDHVECLKHPEVLQPWLASTSFSGLEKGSVPAAVRSGRSASSPDPGHGKNWPSHPQGWHAGLGFLGQQSRCWARETVCSLYLSPGVQPPWLHSGALGMDLRAQGLVAKRSESIPKTLAYVLLINIA